GSFYPAGLDEQAMLPFYAQHFSSVEINYTFYRMPTVPSIVGWAQATPAEFKLALRAPRTITHIRQLKGAGGLTSECLRRANVLQDKLAVVIFQIAPEHELDVLLLGDFI